ncbi:hypothetical protein [Glycomyces rhizosphaerae]|uniref:Uncharacterized protein n=1 Tax=Glycomyces rhizosphaerae TaxID=2054422 RepID=A0ABV7PZJ2_9ACTN
MQDPPPEREFGEAEAYPLLEQIVADTVTDLPDFPGVYRRGYARPQDCGETSGSQYDGWVAIEIWYGFTGDISATDLVKLEYTNLLRQAWTDAGYDVHRDTINPDTGRGSLEAVRPDGINLWWSVADGVSLTLQTGCVPATEGFEKPEYIPPAGGVLPENDLAVKGDNFENPPEDATDEAVDPFATAQPVSAPVPFDSPDSYDGLI